jgi:hypothetical protein
LESKETLKASTTSVSEQRTSFLYHPSLYAPLSSRFLFVLWFRSSVRAPSPTSPFFWLLTSTSAQPNPEHSHPPRVSTRLPFVRFVWPSLALALLGSPRHSRRSPLCSHQAPLDLFPSRNSTPCTHASFSSSISHHPSVATRFAGVPLTGGAFRNQPLPDRPNVLSSVPAPPPTSNRRPIHCSNNFIFPVLVHGHRNTGSANTVAADRGGGRRDCVRRRHLSHGRWRAHGPLFL